MGTKQKAIDLIDFNAVKLALARKDFFEYCATTAPDFYKHDRHHLVNLCELLQRFYEDKDKKILIINMPPRHGKSRTGGKFVEWVLGQNPSEKIMTGSYNEMLSTTFAKNVRNAISEEKADENITVYSDIFPRTAIKRGDARANLWSLEGQYNSYLATSPTGTATGFGCSLLIIDDVIKNAEEANNEMVKEKHWEWFTNTMLSRVEKGGKIIIIMTRWATNDLAGRAIEHFGDRADVISMKAVQDDGTMLCDAILSLEDYQEKTRAMGLDIASANYQQEPIDVKGRMYGEFKTYTDKPEFRGIYNYTDTADTGADFLCSIVYGLYDKEAYILDVLYTKSGMEVTEPKTAELLHNNSVNVAYIESNNGGRGFARNVRDILRRNFDSNSVGIRTFHQNKNKDSRIYSQSAWVMEHVYMPVNWRDRWPEFYAAISSYQREGKNAHDDAADALTGVAEFTQRGAGMGVMK